MEFLPSVLWLNMFLLLASGALHTRPANQDQLLLSLDQQLGATVAVVVGEAFYSIYQGGSRLLLPSKLGMVREDADFSKNLKLLRTGKTQRVRNR